MGTKPHRYEVIGVLMVLIGCIFMVTDPNALRVGVNSSSVVPAVLDAASAFFGAIYFLMSAKNVKSIPIFFLIFMMSAHTFLFNSLLAKF
jgi:drug/metabolite transporter (DMT)-like permease